MPDITMCHGSDIDNGECPDKERCKRYTAIPSQYWQSYFKGTPIENGKCDYLWEEETPDEE